KTLQTASRRIERLIRYGIAGAATTLVYTGLALLLHRPAILSEATLASAVAFLATPPLAFLLHKRISFPHPDRDGVYLLRFLVVAAAGFATTVLTMAMIDQAGWPFLSGLVIGWIVVPLVGFLVNAMWVFRVRHAAKIVKSPPHTQ